MGKIIFINTFLNHKIEIRNIIILLLFYYYIMSYYYLYIRGNYTEVECEWDDPIQDKIHNNIITDSLITLSNISGISNVLMSDVYYLNTNLDEYSYVIIYAPNHKKLIKSIKYIIEEIDEQYEILPVYTYETLDNLMHIRLQYDNHNNFINDTYERIHNMFSNC